MKEFNVCYIIGGEYDHKNDYIEMLNKSLKTLLMFYEVDNLYIIVNKNNIDNLQLDINFNNCKHYYIKYIDIDITSNIKYPINSCNAGRINRTALLKFYIPYIVECNDIFYFDCDILFINNLKNNLIENISDNCLIKMWDTEYGANSGIFYLNCKLYKLINVLKDVKKYYDDNYLTSNYIDQSCFVHLLDIYKDNIVLSKNEKDNININIDFDVNINSEDIKKIDFNLTTGIYHMWGWNKALFNKMFEKINKYN